MAKHLDFNQWLGGASEADFQEMLRIAKQRRIIYFFLALIPFVHFITTGLFIFTDNTVRFMNKRGQVQGSPSFLGNIAMIWGFILPPIIVVQLCSRINSLGHVVLGWNKN